MALLQNITNRWTYTFTASNTSSFLVIPPSSSTSLLMTYYGAAVASGSVANPLVLQLSVNGGSSFVTTGYTSGINYIGPYTATSLTNQNTTSGIIWTFAPVIGTTAGANYIFGLNTSSHVTLNGTATTPNGSTGIGYVGGSLPTTTAVNSFRVTCVGDTIASGAFRFYALE